MNQRSWLVRRAFLALALMIGFYAMAVGIAVSLLWVPYAEFTYLNRVDLRIAVFCLGLAGAILWAILPRPDRFEAPGPSLHRETHPRLFEAIDSVAAATGQQPPAEVFLVNQVNAWVAHRGGMMGVGSRRVMGVGLPLLQALSPEEFKAVLAHEFGHYSAGDVALGPWIYKTRAAIGRALHRLEGRALQRLFIAYGNLFMRLTQGISRQQEFLADQVAARVAGSLHAATALKKLPGVELAFGGYWEEELMPVLGSGFLPPIAAGFRQFLASQEVARRCGEISAAAVHGPSATEFDTHPSLPERLAALGHPPDLPITMPPDRAASTWLENPEELAWELLRQASGDAAVERLQALGWEDVARVVYEKNWRDTARSNAGWLSRFRSDDLPVGADAYVRLAAEFVPLGSRDEKQARAAGLIGVGLAVALLDAGWKIDTGVGKPLVLRPAGDRGDGAEGVRPFDVVRALCEASLTLDAWRATCRDRGIAGLPLGAGARVQPA